ncbi:Protein of unknown function [Fontimonas thermophila]|uniref:DUF1674 domain-containing protein n=1 Tax=Fontimonas thermophila TaxID=1076937 RepID=A0A1I2JJL8_9GAMM|nr:Protein of unknown function [Fontimonas thermophila]
MSARKDPPSDSLASRAPRDAVPLAELLEQQRKPVPEIGGRTDGPEPTRYGDWEKNGRCIDF